MSKFWEYKVLHYSTRLDAQRLKAELELNKLSEEDWEPLFVARDSIVLRRPTEEWRQKE